MRRAVCAVLLLMGCRAGLEAQQSISWTKDYIRDSGGGTIAIAVPPPSDTTAPSTPSITSITPDTYSAQVNWSASSDSGGSGLAGYRVYRGAALVGTVGAVTSFTDSALLPDTEYSYTVAAFDGAGNVSSPSSAVTVTTLEE